MMYKKYYISALLFISSLYGFSQQSIKDAIVIIRPEYNMKTEKVLTDYANSLDIDGYIRAAAALKAYVSGGFSNGFVYTDSKTSASYIITAKQPVAITKYVTVEIMLSDKSTKTYASCPVTAIDPKTELAAIALPGNVDKLNSISFSDVKIEDGIDIYTAGYANVNKEPLWQLSKGIISNAAMYFQEEENLFAQHTAQLNAGTTGSLLLVRDNVTGKYEALGINVWKPTGREDVNVAIPISEIKTFIETCLQNQTSTELSTQVNNLISRAKDGYKAILPFIAYDYISGVSVYAAYDYMTHLPEDMKPVIERKLQNGNPIEAMRVAIAHHVAQKLNKAQVSVQSISEKSDSAEVKFLISGKEVTSVWQRKNGIWQLSSFLNIDYAEKIKENNTAAKDYDLSFTVSVNLGRSLTDRESNYYGMTLSYIIYKYMPFDLAFSMNKIAMYEIDLLNYNSYKPKYIWKKYGYGSVELRTGVQFPIKTGKKLFLVPAIKPLLGIDIGEDIDSRFSYGYLAQAEVAYRVNNSISLIAGLGYKSKYFMSDIEEFKMPFSSIIVNVGIAL